jgi:anti-sigma regulatory factor (Ser/Thr protein kinase)
MGTERHFRRTDILGPFEYRFAPSPKGARLARQVLDLWLREQPVADDRAHDISVAGSELVSNAITHGAEAEVTLGARVEGDGIMLEVHDDGRGFTVTASPFDEPDPEAESGRGLQIVASLTDHLEVRCEDGTTVVRAFAAANLLDLTDRAMEVSAERERHLVGEEPARSIEP